MKELRIIREQKLGEKDWYSLYVDNDYVKGSYDRETIEKLYEEIEANPNCFIKNNEIIRSTKININ